MLKDRELIFRPQLVSKQLREKSAEGRPRKEEELIMYGRMINEKKEMARVINSQYEDTRFNFVPKINKKSEKIVMEKSRYLNSTSQANKQGSPTQNTEVVTSPDYNARKLPSPKNIKNLDEQMRAIGQPIPDEMVMSPSKATVLKDKKFHDLYEEGRQR